MLALVLAGQKLASWGESLQLRGLDGLYRSRRQLGPGDVDALSALDDVKDVVVEASRLQEEADDLAGRSVVAEAAAVSGVSEYALRGRLEAAVQLRRLPGTAEALRVGVIDWPKTRAMTNAVQGTWRCQLVCV
jgi:hypothetical protein